jgi:hypothetical protein
MDYLLVDKIRKRVWHSISQETANQAGEGMQQRDLQSFIAFQFLPSEIQLTRLANYLGVKL